MNLLIFGPPGSGKGTYASRLQLKLAIPTVATGDICRKMAEEGNQTGKMVAEYMRRGVLVPDNIVVRELKKRLAAKDCERGFILDGYPRTLSQAKMLEDFVKVDALIHLIVPDSIIVERLSSRRVCSECGTVYNIRFLKPKMSGICDQCGGRLYQRFDDTIEVIKGRLEVYNEQTAPILKYYKERVPFIKFKCDSLDVPPEVAVSEILNGLKHLS